MKGKQSKRTWRWVQAILSWRGESKKWCWGGGERRTHQWCAGGKEVNRQDDLCEDGGERQGIECSVCTRTTSRM